MAARIEADLIGVLDTVNRLAYKASQDNCEIEVGYAASYAVLIHEDLTMPHSNGQAKYLEQPMHQYQDELVQLVRDMRSAGIPLKTALEAMGRLLLEKSQPLVPVDTGFLRDSAFVEVQ